MVVIAFDGVSNGGGMHPKKGQVEMPELLFACIDLAYEYNQDDKVREVLKKLLAKFEIPDNNLSAGDIYRPCEVDPKIWKDTLRKQENGNQES